MSQPDHLAEIVLFLAAAVIIVAIFRLLKLSPVLGYLAAGGAIGPYGLKLVSDTSAAGGIAEFGVVFLLFILGLELSLSRLMAMRRQVFGLGLAQMLVTGLIGAAILLALGFSAPLAVIISGGLALSSTAVALQAVAETGERSSQVGRLTLAVLILQDLAVIPLLVLLPSLSPSGTDIPLAPQFLTAAGKALLGLGVMLAAGRLLLKPLFRFIASLKNAELFTATAMLVVLGTSWGAQAAGLSLAMGAFMAGLMVAETEFKPQVEADMLPYRGLLLGVFFMTVGMSVDLTLVAGHFPFIVLLTLLLMAGKAAILTLVCRLFGFGFAAGAHTGLLLSQGGEFAFVLFALAAQLHAMDDATAQILLVVVTLSMALTPPAAMLGKRLAAWIERRSAIHERKATEETLDLSDHVIISGFGRVGRTVARLLEAESIPYVAIDMDPVTVAKSRKAGAPVYYGDASRAHVLKSLSLPRAKSVIITHNETRVSEQAILAIRTVTREVPIIVRAKNIEQVQRLEKAGANLAVAEMFETSLQLGGSLLLALGVAEHEVSRILAVFRAEDYALTRKTENVGTTNG